MYLILLEILCWVRIWFQIWCATNGSLARSQNVSFLNTFTHFVQKWHILRYSKRTVCRTSNPKPYSDSVKNFWKNEIHEHYIISFFQKISKNMIYVGFWNIVYQIFNFDGSSKIFSPKFPQIMQLKIIKLCG